METHEYNSDVTFDTDPANPGDMQPFLSNATPVMPAFAPGMAPGAESDMAAGFQADPAPMGQVFQAEVAPAFQADMAQAFQTNTAPAFQADMAPAFQADPAQAFQANTPQAFQADMAPAFQAAPAQAFQANAPQAFQAGETSDVQPAFMPASQQTAAPAAQANISPAFRPGPNPGFRPGPGPGFRPGPTPGFRPGPVFCPGCVNFRPINNVLWTWGLLGPSVNFAPQFARVRFYNATSIREPLNIYLNSRLVLSNLNQMNSSGFLSIQPGTYRLTIYRSGILATPVVDANVTFFRNRSYLLTITGTAWNARIQLSQQ